MPVNKYFISFCETMTVTTACTLPAKPSREWAPASVKISITLMKFQNYWSFARQRKILACADCGISVNRTKPAELLGRSLSSLLSLHCSSACTAPQYMHKTFVLVLLSPCNPPIKLVEGCQKLNVSV